MADADFRISMYRGDTLDLELALWADDDATVPYSVADASEVRCQVREYPGYPVVATAACSVTGESTVRLVVPAEGTEAFDPDTLYQFDVEVHFPDGHVHTVAYGLLDVRADITRSDA